MRPRDDSPLTVDPSPGNATRTVMLLIPLIGSKARGAAVQFGPGTLRP